MLLGQKKLLDIYTPDSWPVLSPLQISNDGRYISYIITSLKAGTWTVIQSTDGTKKRELIGVKNGRFTEDGYCSFLVNLLIVLVY